MLDTDQLIKSAGFAMVVTEQPESADPLVWRAEAERWRVKWRRLVEGNAALRQQVGLLHADETAAHVGGELACLHVACNDGYTAMHTPVRSTEDIDASGVLPGFAVSWARAGYAGYQHLVQAHHAWYGPHPLRDLRGLHEADPHRQPGAQAMATTLVMALKETRTAGQPSLSQEQPSCLI